MNGPSVSLADAARTTGKSQSTIRRWLADDAIPGAIRTDQGSWQIPIAGLIAAGLEPSITPAGTSKPKPSKPTLIEPSAPPSAPPVTPPEVERLRADLEAARERETAALRAQIERLERNERTLIETIERMSRALPSGSAADAPPVAEVVPGTSNPVADSSSLARRAFSKIRNPKRFR
jgi:hypothetical protein